MLVGNKNWEEVAAKKGKKGKAKEKEAPAAPAGDLFGELVGALMRRRKAVVNPGPVKKKKKDDDEAAAEGGEDFGKPQAKNSDLSFDQNWEDE